MLDEYRELSVHERMIGIVGALPAIGANQVNKQQGYNFRGYADVLNALNPLLDEWGVFFVPEVIECRTEERARSSGSGSMFVTRLHVRYTFFGAKGDSVQASAWGEGSDAGDKGTSKAMTGAMKYVLFQAFAISVSEVQDGDASSPEPSRAVTPAQALAARKAEWGDKPLPEGWANYEEFDEAHETMRVGLANSLPHDKERIGKFMDEHSMGWPLTKAEYDSVTEYVRTMPVESEVM